MLTFVPFLFFLVPMQKIAAQFLNLSSDYPATHTFSHDNVEYILCQYRVTWEEARVICLSYKAELAMVDTDRKARVAIRAIADSDLPISENLWIGAREDSPDSWFWISSGNNQVTLKDVPRRGDSLLYANSSRDNLQCLSLDRVHHDAPVFVPSRCDQRRPFICQRDYEKLNSKNIRIAGSTRIDKEELVLYSARLTWPQAVVWCRREGLQIAEIETTAQLQSLAFLMIRARPESIESAWIGGYATGNAWRWLPSDRSISSNDSRGDDNGGSRGCLLLDRHMCEVPVYRAAKCDLKRDVICQRPAEKRTSEKPSLVYVEGCPYWIGLRALTWFQAQLSCREFNASLVILDSSRIIRHMMLLMEDNGEELRHIWTDGRRKSSSRLTSNGKALLRRWAWESTGEPVSEIGASLVPWCTAGQCRDDGANCLNLDRAGYDAPVVYGLACNQSQTYVCQPRSGPCVSRDEDSPRTPSPPRTSSPPITTASYYDEEVNRRSFHVASPINRGLPSNATSRFHGLRKNLNFKGGTSSTVNFSEQRNDDYARKSYVDKIAYVKVTTEEGKGDDVKNTTAFPFYGSSSAGPIEMKVTAKDIENNIHGEFKLNSSLVNNIARTMSNEEIRNRSRFKYFPLKMLDENSTFDDKLKISRIFARPLVYVPINRYYYYYPWYYVRSDRKNMLSSRNKDRGTRLYYMIPEKKIE